MSDDEHSPGHVFGSVVDDEHSPGHVFVGPFFFSFFSWLEEVEYNSWARVCALVETDLGYVSLCVCYDGLDSV